MKKLCAITLMMKKKKTMKNKGQQKKKANRDNLNVDERNS